MKKNKKIMMIAGIWLLFCIVLFLWMDWGWSGKTDLNSEKGIPEEMNKEEMALSEQIPDADDEENTDPVKDTDTERDIDGDADKDLYESGTYHIGRDMPEGEYLITSDDPYICILISDNEEMDEETSYNNIFYGRCYMTFTEGEYVSFTGKAVPANKAAPYVPEDGMAYPEGGYLVGKDMEAGRYEIFVPSSSTSGIGYYVISGSSDPYAPAEDIRGDELTGSVEIKLRDGEYVTLSGLSMKRHKKK